MNHHILMVSPLPVHSFTKEIWEQDLKPYGLTAHNGSSSQLEKPAAPFSSIKELFYVWDNAREANFQINQRRMSSLQE